MNATLVEFFEMYSHYPVALFLFIILSSFVLEDPVTFGVGVLLSKNIISIPFAVTSLGLGIFLGDLGLYLLGRGVREGLFKSKVWTFSPTRFEIVIARFIPGLRTITFSAAGFMRFPIRSFLFSIFPSAILWTSLLLLSTQYLVHSFPHLSLWLWIGVGFGVMLLGRVIGYYKTKLFAVDVPTRS